MCPRPMPPTPIMALVSSSLGARKLPPNTFRGTTVKAVTVIAAVFRNPRLLCLKSFMFVVIIFICYKTKFNNIRQRYCFFHRHNPFPGRLDERKNFSATVVPDKDTVCFLILYVHIKIIINDGAKIIFLSFIDRLKLFAAIKAAVLFVIHAQ
jgi:hypothetical protein